MTEKFDVIMNRATVADIGRHLLACDEQFVHSLSKRVDIYEYSKKIYSQAERFEVWAGNSLVGMLAAYCNDLTHRVAYITSISVLNNWQGKGIALQLLNRFMDYAQQKGMHRVQLEVEKENKRAIGLYKRSGFTAVDETNSNVTMNLIREQGEKCQK